MIHNWWTLKSFVYAAAITSLACVAVIVAIKLAIRSRCRVPPLVRSGSARGWRLSGPPAAG